MSALPNCPKCKSEYTYEDGSMYVCPECAHEWSAQAGAESTDQAKVWKDANGNVSQYGIQILSTGFAYWMLQTLTTPNDVLLANEAGTKVNFDNPKVIEALD